jgi:hypothetical protein
MRRGVAHAPGQVKWQSDVGLVDPTGLGNEWPTGGICQSEAMSAAFQQRNNTGIVPPERLN